jgi:hypothetical protein
MSHRQENVKRPISTRGRQRLQNFEDESDYSFSAFGNKGRRQSLAYQSADIKSSTVLEARMIGLKEQKRSATTRNNKALSGNFLAEAREARNRQEDASPEFKNTFLSLGLDDENSDDGGGHQKPTGVVANMFLPQGLDNENSDDGGDHEKPTGIVANTFLSQGLDNEDNDDGGGHEKPTGIMAGAIGLISNLLSRKRQHSSSLAYSTNMFSRKRQHSSSLAYSTNMFSRKRQHSSSPAYSTKKKCSKQKDKMDTSMTALTHSPSSSAKKKKSKEQVVIDLVNSDSDEDNEPSLKPRHAAASSTRETKRKRKDPPGEYCLRYD